MTHLHALLRTEEGTYTVEVALVMPVFVTLLFGFISVSLLLFAYCQATYAAQVEVRRASLCSNTSKGNPTTADTTTSVQNDMNGRVLSTNGGSVTTTVNWSGGNTPLNAIGNTVAVTVQVKYPVSLPFIPLSSITLSSTAQSLILN